MQEKIGKIIAEAKEKLQRASLEKEVEEIRIHILGRNGKLTELFKEMGKLSKEMKITMGPVLNSAKAEMEELIAAKFTEAKAAAKQAKFAKEKIDVTEPGRDFTLGVKHPLTITIEEISRIFLSMGYSIAEGPEVETVFNAFDALNSPPNHPSRDKTDTFYISEDTVLRPHTSSVQIRTLIREEPPIKVISPEIGRAHV